MNSDKLKLHRMGLVIGCFLAFAVFAPTSRAQVPVFEITKSDSTIKFKVDSSVSIVGKFDQSESTLTFTSPELETAVLDIKIQADSVDTGSGMKNGKLKGKDFFAVSFAQAKN